MSTISDWPTDLSNATQEPAPSEPGADLRRVFLGHKLLLLVALSIGAGLGYLKFTRATPEYASAAQVWVARNQARLPVEGANSQANAKVPIDTHVALLKTPKILNGAYELLTKADRDDIFPARIAAGLTAVRSEDSDEIITLTYRGSNASDCKLIVDNVVKAYIEFIHKTQLDLNESTVDLITRAKEELATTLSQKENEYAKFREASQLLWVGDEGRNIHQERLVQIQSALDQLQDDGSRIRGEINSINAELEKGEKADLDALLASIDKKLQLSVREMGERQGITPGSTIDEKLFPLELELQTLQEKYGPDHPRLIAHRNQMERYRSFLEGRMTAETSGKPREDLINVYLSSLAHELDQLDEMKREYESQAAIEGESAKLVSSDENKNRALREDIKRTQDLYDVLLVKLQEIDLVKGGDYLAVDVVTSAALGIQVAPKLPDNLALGSVLGLLAGIALAFLVELSDKSFRGPEQIMKQMGLPVIGHVPTIRTQKSDPESALDASLVAHHRPRSRLTESYRAVRVPLLFGAKQNDMKVIQITSPDPGDGKSTVAANLAIVMANSGKRCLLIDADFRRPRVHKLFGVANDVGLATVITDEAELSDVIQSCEVDNLELMSCGGRPKNPAELLLAPRFEEILSVLREKYDFVLIDTPPVLAVTDPSAAASRVDGVLLVIRITKRVRLHSMRARETLALIGAKVIGVVVNGIGESNTYAYGTGVYSYKSSQYQYAKSPYGPYQSYGYSEYYSERENEPGENNGAVAATQPAGHVGNDQ